MISEWEFQFDYAIMKTKQPFFDFDEFPDKEVSFFLMNMSKKHALALRKALKMAGDSKETNDLLRSINRCKKLNEDEDV